MARSVGYSNTASFVKGLITEASELNFPADASVDEDNCELLKAGNRRRRLGVDVDGSLSNNALALPLSTLRDEAISEHRWTNPGDNPDKEFYVIQVGATLYFFDATNDVVGQKKTFTVDLSLYKAPAAAKVGCERVHVSSGDGKAFVVSSVLEPIFIAYDDAADTIAVTQIAVRIRDLEGVDDGLDPDEEPSSLSTLHTYNLKNQGWVPTSTGTGGIDALGAMSNPYPANNKPWWVGLDEETDITNPVFVVNTYRAFPGGSSLAPRGHYLLNPFNKDRDAAAGLSGIPDEDEATRPKAAVFFASRLFLGFKGQIYFTRIVDSDPKLGHFYQVNDPSERDGGELLPTDGGIIDIPEAGEFLFLFSTGSSLVAFATNGVWTIKGADRGFRADEFQIQRASDVGLAGKDSIVDVEGSPIWWTDRGVYTIKQNDVSLEITAASITDDSIQTFFNSIKNKINVVGHYDKTRRRCIWLYENEDTVGSHLNKFNKALLLDVDLGAWYPWSFPELDDTNADVWIAGIIDTPNPTLIEQAQNVVDSTGDSIVDTALEDVIASASIAVDRKATVTKFLLAYSADKTGGSTYGVSFGIAKNSNFIDFEAFDTVGVDYTSYAISGYDMQGDLVRFKQNPYIFFFFRRTETGFVNDGSGNVDFLNPSGCTVQTRWQFTDSDSAKRWSKEVDAYKIRRLWTPSLDDLSFDNGFPVVTSRHKVRGKGQSLNMKFTSVSGKDFNLLGWGMKLTGNSDV